ncbi:MAG TPA: RluA family pseudouridine synthase [Pyrinomonadaceae bacterium]|jgi:23S rRNA pseudouridine1911/1915/1917 synthase
MHTNFAADKTLMKRYEFQVTEAENKTRLEDFLLARFRTLSKIYLREVVRDERCEVNGRLENRGFKLRTNDFIEIEIDNSRQTTIEPESVPLEIVYEDPEILVVNKPAGMLVHPTLKVRTGTLLNGLVFYLNQNLVENKENYLSYIRAGLIHRLDKDTSGLLVIGKNARAHRILCSHFQRKLVEKRYFALVDGSVNDESGTIKAPIGRYAEEKIWNIKPDGKQSITNFWVKNRCADRTLLELEPVTGRTNQLRIHLAHVGHPITGDEKYGGKPFQRMCLHAYKLCFRHPSGGKRMEFVAETQFVEK